MRSSSLSLQPSSISNSVRYSRENKKMFTSAAKELPENVPALLLSAVYSGDEQKVYLKFYNEKDQTILFWRDRTNHRPYCFTKINYRDAAEKVIQKKRKYSSEITKKRDLISDKEIECLKIVAPDPLSIGGTENSFREKVTCWEADIKYHENYLYDTGLIPGTCYIRTGDSLTRFEQPISHKVQDELQKLLWNKRKENSNGVSNGKMNPLIPEAEVYKTEKELLQETFRIISSYPFVITYNGDDFDLPYLYARSQDPAIDSVNGKAIPKEEIPIIVKRETFVKRGIQAEPVQIKNGIHIDLFRTFQNRSVQIYAFSHKYSEYTLNAISEALLNDSKYEFEGDISELSTDKLAQYCMKDADLTCMLTKFNDNLLMKLLVVIARIGRLSIDDIARFGVNQWIRGMLYYEHRHHNALIPRRDELQAKGTASTTAIIKEKKYRGGLVVEPTLGIHFNVVVVDFASLYPSIIKVH